MISQFLLLSARGDTLIVKDFRNDMTKSTPEVFYRTVKTSQHDPEPLFNKDGINYAFVKNNSLYLVVTSRFNISPSTVFDFLNNVVKIIKDYCGVFTEEAIRKNFVLIYEILDEMMDFGYPQASKVDEIKPLIVSEVTQIAGQKTGKSGFLNINFNTIDSNAAKKSITAKSANELFVDGIERVNVVFNSSGCVINSSIDGCIQMKSYLVGEPTVKLCLCDDVITNDNQTHGIRLESYSFNKCVDDTQFEMNRVLLIKPPQGEAVAMNYKITQSFGYPFKIYPFISEISSHKLELQLKIVSNYGTDATASKVNIKFNVPPSLSTIKLELPKEKEVTRLQKADYDDSEKAVNWEITKFQGQKTHSLVAIISMKDELNSYQIRKEIGPIKMSFEINNYMASGLAIKYMRIENHGQAKPPQRWLRYITQSNSYISRV
jgi:AP-4 complex subunit mu-1